MDLNSFKLNHNKRPNFIQRGNICHPTYQTLKPCLLKSTPLKKKTLKHLALKKTLKETQNTWNTQNPEKIQ